MVWLDSSLSVVFATARTSTHQRVTWPGLYRTLIGFLRIVVWHMRVSTPLLEATWLEYGVGSIYIVWFILMSWQPHVLEVLVVSLHMCTTFVLIWNAPRLCAVFTTQHFVLRPQNESSGLPLCHYVPVMGYITYQLSRDLC